MWLFSALLALVAAVGGQFVLARLGLGRSFVARFLIVGCGIGLVLAGDLMKRYGGGVEFWAGVFVFAFACELYLFLVTLVASSVSVSLLRVLRHGSASRAEVDRGCSGRDMVAARLMNLCRSGLLRRPEAGYAVTRHGQWLLILFRALRFFFHRRLLPVTGAG